jgi:Tol biopolymer transport system component
MRLRGTFVPLVAAIGLAVAVSVTFARQDSAQYKVLFEKAKFTMETKGDLAGAIALFEEIIRKYPNEREYAAQALLQIGLCYEKLGVEGARGAYQRLIKNYPGQTAAVAVAQERLDNLLRAVSLAKKGEQDITIRKVLTPKGELLTEAISPDGKYLADIGDFVNNRGELRITEILTGKERFLRTEGPNCWQGPYAPRWSPDSTKLAVMWGRGLCVIPLDGSASRFLVATPLGNTWVEPLDWSPDQKHILVLGTYTGEWKSGGLSLVAVADGSARSLKIGDAVAFGSPDCRFSPDGLTIACNRGPKQGKRDIFLFSADGSRETPLVQHPADDALLEWLPDGRGILFASDRGGTIDLWSLQIEKGRPQGAPTLVRRSIGPTTPMRLTKSGAFYYETPASFMDVYTATLDPRTGNVAGEPKKEPLPWEGHNRWPDWSPDGRRLAYVSVRPTVVGPYAPGRARESLVCIYSADTGKVREYPGVRTSSTSWSPDGRYLYVTASLLGGGGIYRINVESGEFTPVLLEANGGGVQVSADRQWIVFCRNRRLQRRNVQSGEEKELDGPDVYPGRLALSPDGRRLAWVLESDEKTRVLKVMPFPDGTPKEIQRLKDPDSRIAWSPDGRFIYYSDLPPAGGKDCHLWRAPADGGTAQDLGSVANFHEHLSVHPDGSRITFSTETLNPEPPQLWVMENFLPAAKGSK